MSISKQKTSLFFRLSISVTVFGALFKFISWPIIILGATGMIVFHSIQFFQNKQKTVLDYSRHFLILSFTCNYIFNLLSLPYLQVFSLITKLALVAFLLFYVKKIMVSFKDITQNNTLLINSFDREDLSFILADLATVYVVMASLFKILNWELGIINANVLLVIGLFSALISILANPRGFSK